MIQRPHPDFRARFNKNAILSICASILLGTLAFLTLNSGFKHITTLLFAAFGLAVTYAVVLSFYRLYNVKCPQCRNKTKTIKDVNNALWLAECKPCQIRWDLGIQPD